MKFCCPEKTSYWWSTFLWRNLRKVEKLSIVLASIMGTGSLISTVVFAVINVLADRKRYWNRSWFSGIYGAERSWKKSFNLLLSFDWEPWPIVCEYNCKMFVCLLTKWNIYNVCLIFVLCCFVREFSVSLLTREGFWLQRQLISSNNSAICILHKVKSYFAFIVLRVWHSISKAIIVT